MNANIPPLKIKIFSPYITDQLDGVEEGYAFAVQSFRGRCLQFHVLMQSGAHFRQIPLHYLWHDTPDDSKELELEMLQLWDCFSNKPTVTVFDFLRDLKTKQKCQLLTGLRWTGYLILILSQVSCSNLSKTSVPMSVCWLTDKFALCRRTDLLLRMPTISEIALAQKPRDTLQWRESIQQRLARDGQ
jgi:hypothetical protein